MLSILRMVNRFRPREGWILFLLLLTALLCVPAAMDTLGLDLGTEGLLILPLLAVILSLRLARSRLRASTAALLAGLLGVGLVTLIVGRLLPPFSFLWTDLGNAVHWLSRWPPRVAGQPLPFSSTAVYAGQRLLALGFRLWQWGQMAAGGSAAQDPIVLLLFASFLVWGLGCFATWQVYRQRSVFPAMLPAGVVLATVSFFSGGLSLFYLVVYLFCTLALVAAWHLRLLQERWQQTGTDYPADLELELVFALALVLILTTVLGATFPVLGPRQIGDAFWRVMDRPWSVVEKASERIFGPIEHQGGPAGLRGSGTLPRAHLLGSGPELSETVVLYVTTDDPAPPPPAKDGETEAVEGSPVPRRYWRAVTYDTYTGTGWSNGPLEQRSIPPNQPLFLDYQARSNSFGRVDLVQRFEVLQPGVDAVYAVNAPLYVDRTVQSWWRSPGDLARMASPALHYVAVSRPPEPTIADLRQASPSVPPQIADRYLALPDTIPQEVLDLARRVVGERPTRYDQARAIETYLRAYPYTLDLPDPPADRDLVDYFLFYLQEGYCDYYASAMVVMARAVGIPARLAVGYAQGTYDYDLGHWVVTEEDGHTWVEVYFDGVGWVEFEPTAGLPALDRPGGQSIPDPVVPPLPPRAALWWQRIPWLLVGLFVVLLFAVAFLFYLWRPARRPGPGTRDLVRDRYARLLRWGARLDHPLREGQTPSEYAATLGHALHARGQNARLARVRESSHQIPSEVRQLADSFSRAQYAARPATDRERSRIQSLWSWLRRRLWWLWLAGR